MGIGRPFQPGNKAGKGRRPGSRNRRTILLETLEGNGAQIVERLVSLALKSDPAALRLCIERLLPVSRTRFKLGPVETPANLTAAITAVTEAVAQGELAAREGESMARIIESQRRNMELQVLDDRMKTLEEKVGKVAREQHSR